VPAHMKEIATIVLSAGIGVGLGYATACLGPFWGAAMLLAAMLVTLVVRDFEARASTSPPRLTARGRHWSIAAGRPTHPGSAPEARTDGWRDPEGRPVLRPGGQG